MKRKKTAMWFPFFIVKKANFDGISFITSNEEVLLDFINNSSNDITIYNQLRFVIEYKKNQIGFIDLFDYDSINKKAGIGIIIDEEFQNKNYGSESLDILIKYSFKELDLLSTLMQLKLFLQ